MTCPKPPSGGGATETAPGDRTALRLEPDQWDHWYRTGHPTVVSHKETELFYHHVAPKAGMRAVDLACGNGQWTRQLTAWGLTVHGFDFAPEALKQAAAAGSHGGLTYGRWDIDGEPIPSDLRPGAVDVATCRYALPYLQYERLLTDVGRWLRPSGTFYALAYVDRSADGSSKPGSDPFHRAFTDKELQALGSGWAYRQTYSLSRTQMAVVLRDYG